MSEYDLLRVEANPAKAWEELTEQQQRGLEKLLKMLVSGQGDSARD